MILVGVALAIGGAILSLASILWTYFGFALLGDSTINRFILVLYGLAAAQIALFGAGLFLIFEGLARLAPTTRPWSRVGAIVILIAAVAGTAGGLAEIAIFSRPSLNSGIQVGSWENVLLAASHVAGSAGLDIGLVLALIGTVVGLTFGRWDGRPS